MTTRTESIESQSAGERAFLPELALLTTIALWASTFIVTKDAFSHFHVMAFVFARFGLMLIMAFAVLAVVRWRSPETRTLPRRADLVRYLAAGLAGFTVYQLGFNLGLDRTSIFSASLLISTSPLFTILVLTLIGERPPAVAWIGVAIAITGVALFLSETQGGGRSATGDLLCIMAAAAFGLYGVVNRPLVADYPAATYTAWTLLFGGVPLLIAALPAASDQDWGALSSRSWLAVLYMVIFPVYIAYMLWNFGIARRGAAIATSFGLLVPVVAGTLSALFYDETFGPRKLIGAALVLGGLLFIRVGPRWLSRRSPESNP
ncbi:MAG: EamA family transporter [Thermomicrobiales bacterium]|nr:EamA family transporter [Thermomicrobiales bacterium]MCO5222061.1 EamA family transporter [Thermomicrobiales bacterium]